MSIDQRIAGPTLILEEGPKLRIGQRAPCPQFRRPPVHIPTNLKFEPSFFQAVFDQGQKFTGQRLRPRYSKICNHGMPPTDDHM
jgi:hypothetical protein